MIIVLLSSKEWWRYLIDIRGKLLRLSVKITITLQHMDSEDSSGLNLVLLSVCRLINM